MQSSDFEGIVDPIGVGSKRRRMKRGGRARGALTIILMPPPPIPPHPPMMQQPMPHSPLASLLIGTALGHRLAQIRGGRR